MTFTTEQINELSEFENNFFTAIHASYSRYVGKEKLERIAAIYEAATGMRHPVDYTCNYCVVRLLVEVGNLYFDDVKETLRR